MNFRFVKGDDYNIYLMNKDVEVGRISNDDMIPDRLFSRLESVAEIELVASAEKLNEYMHLNYITIHDAHRYKGLFTKAMTLYETHIRESNFKAITLFADQGLSSVYKKLGYKELGYIQSLNSFLMKKELV